MTADAAERQQRLLAAREADRFALVADRHTLDSIATLLGTSGPPASVLQLGVLLDDVARLVARVRPDPGASETAAGYRAAFYEATGRPVVPEYDADAILLQTQRQLAARADAAAETSEKRSSRD